jgi:hypothetical protein
VSRPLAIPSTTGLDRRTMRTGVLEERGEHPIAFAPAADARHGDLRQGSGAREELRARLVARSPAGSSRTTRGIRMRPRDRPDARSGSVSTFVTQSLKRLVHARPSACATPLVTGMHAGLPSARIRSTFGACRATSRSPPCRPRTTRPSSAQALAVATPCCPAPVSAITRWLPEALARGAPGPRSLLTLCAPVCAEILALQKDARTEPAC